MDDIVATERSIREAAAWCRLRADRSRPATSLRSAELLPFEWPSTLDWQKRTGLDQRACRDRRIDLVSEVTRRRRLGLARAGQAVPVDGPMPEDGFLIVIWPDSDLHDECARDVTEGFFDIEELPGHDSWVAYVTASPEALMKLDLDCWSRLIAWIPNVFRDQWDRAKQTSVFDNFDALPVGASAADALAAARRAIRE